MKLTIRIACCCTIAVFLAFALLPIEAKAAKPTIEDLIGRWCEAAQYEFKRDHLTVTFKSGGTKTLRIKNVESGEGWINLIWDPRDGESTSFEVHPDRLVQPGNPEKSFPRREFRRC